MQGCRDQITRERTTTEETMSAMPHPNAFTTLAAQRHTDLRAQVDHLRRLNLATTTADGGRAWSVLPALSAVAGARARLLAVPKGSSPANEPWSRRWRGEHDALLSRQPSRWKGGGSMPSR
jgi:hypothetical protein